MKPARCYFKGERDVDGDWDPLAVDAINRMCAFTRAKIVFNTNWNCKYQYYDIKKVAMRQGIFPKHIHEDHKTIYPSGTYDREEAIYDWLDEHTYDYYIILDDIPMMDKFAIHINPDDGITVEVYREATEMLGCEDKFLVIC